MPLNQANRVAVGSWFVAEINRRIKVRRDAVERAKGQPDKSAEVIARHAALAAKAHRLGSVLSSRILSHHRDVVADRHAEALLVNSTDGHELYVPIRLLPRLADELKNAKSPQGIARSACQEVEFLTAMLGNGPIAGFQSYVSKLHAVPATMPGPATLTAMLDDYLTSRRPAACQIA